MATFKDFIIKGGLLAIGKAKITDDLTVSGSVLVGSDIDNGTDQVQVTGSVLATTFKGALTGNAATATTLQTARTINGVLFDGSANIVVPSGAGNPAFFENDAIITQDYTITSGKNAMSAGPITVNDGVTITIPDGSTWTIV